MAGVIRQPPTTDAKKAETPHRRAAFAASERLQVFDQVVLLPRLELEVSHPVVVIDHIVERQRTAVVEIRWVLPQPA